MIDYRSTDERFEYSPNMEKVYAAMLKRKKNNRTREGVETGGEPDGKTPFFDVFIECRGEPYPIKLAKAIVRSWLVTEPTMHDGEVLVGFPRPTRPVHEHFHIGIVRERHILKHPAYIDRFDELNALMTEMRPEFHPAEITVIEGEMEKRFGTKENPKAYEYTWNELWSLGGYQGHTVPNYDILMTQGIGGVHKRVLDRMKGETEEKKLIMLEACKIILEGLRDWILLQADGADKKADGEADEKLKAQYKHA
ncbi:MAG: hypothetical protein IJB57_03070, partial [Clostridia bacterium]|nr:hypothetical protein [Clostridia bacterium]